VRTYQIPEIFFKSIAEKGNLYSRIWFYWLGGYVGEIFEPDFIEKQEKKYSQISEIREIYEFGIQFLRQDFKIIEEKGKRKKIDNPLDKNIQQLVVKVIEYLNSEAETSFNSESKANYENISARIKEGYTFDDFKKVIDIKIKDWKGTDYEKYIRPITIFSKTKFENYLNSKNHDGKSNNSNQIKQVADAITAAKQILGIYKD
jgi:uncharacterized phage protein (TIGR02220 family)